jgi:hypothetical protein
MRLTRNADSAAMDFGQTLGACIWKLRWGSGRVVGICASLERMKRVRESSAGQSALPAIEGGDLDEIAAGVVQDGDG